MQRRRRRATLLAAIILAQFLCALFFLGDAADDLISGTTIDGAMFTLELIATVALFAGVIYLARELRQLLGEMERMEGSIRAARGEMAEVIDAFFTEWNLTPSERDVALLMLKGIDNEQIA